MSNTRGLTYIGKFRQVFYPIVVKNSNAKLLVTTLHRAIVCINIIQLVPQKYAILIERIAISINSWCCETRVSRSNVIRFYWDFFFTLFFFLIGYASHCTSQFRITSRFDVRIEWYAEYLFARSNVTVLISVAGKWLGVYWWRCFAQRLITK